MLNETRKQASDRRQKMGRELTDYWGRCHRDKVQREIRERRRREILFEVYCVGVALLLPGLWSWIIWWGVKHLSS